MRDYLDVYPTCNASFWVAIADANGKVSSIVLNKVTVSDEILLTALAEVKALLTARPLTNVPVDPTDPQVLTSNNFLLGRASPNVAPVVVSNQDLSARRSWKIAQVLANQFWCRWLKEYASHLVERRKSLGSAK